MHLRPVKAEQRAATVGEQEPGRVEPGFGDPGREVSVRPIALFRVGGECGGVDGKPGVVVYAGPERSHRDLRWQRRIGGQLRRVERQSHLVELADRFELGVA